MNINYIERLKYRLREVLIKINRVNQWIKDNPSKNNANMSEITGFLFEVGWILSDLKNYNNANNTNGIPDDVRKLIEEMKFMLEKRNDSIRTFIDEVGLTDLWNSFVLDVFSGNINFSSTFENLKIKKLVCKEFGVLKYIHERRKEDFYFLYDNKLEFEYMRDLLEQSKNCPEIGKKLFELIESYYARESLKGSDDILEVQSEKIGFAESGNLVDNNLSNSLNDKITLYYDLDNGDIYTTLSIFRRFRKGPLGKPVIIDGKRCLRMEMQDALEIDKNKNNDYSPYKLEVRNVHLGSRKYYQAEAVKEDRDKEEDNKSTLNEKIDYFDDIVFSSREEELKFAYESTKNFSIWDCFINHEKGNAIIFLDANNEFCLHPIKTHLFTVMKLYRALHNSDIDKGTDESAIEFTNSQGIVIFRIVNEGKSKFFVPYFPTSINEFQLEKLKEYYHDFFEVYSYLTINNLFDDDDKSLFVEGLKKLEKYINKYESDIHMHHTM